MTPVLEPPAIRRIVVTLNSSEPAQSVLDVAVRLAAILGAELEGVFVEDINLIRLSGLPFLREVRPWSLAEEGISTQSMQRDLRALARQAERVFLEAAQAMGVGCTFRVWRGHASVETLSASFEADIITLRGGPMLLYHARPSMKSRSPAAAPINVLFGASPAADRALAAACYLAGDLGAEIRVLLADNATPGAELEQRAGEILAAHARQATFVRLGAGGLPALARAIRASGNNTVLLVDPAHPLLREAGLNHCLEALTCPVLFVR
jgi:nucleotide-binding universal stress UspA family protein